MVSYKASASALLLLLLPTGAYAKDRPDKLKLRDTAKKSDGAEVKHRSNKLKLRDAAKRSIEHIDFQEDPIFTPAISLEEFANVDPEQFEWVNPSEIVAGGTTCGFLHAPLGSLPNVVYPIVDVYVCVRFATNQPAPKGNLAVHCGGPGSLSSCVYLMGDWTENTENYNIIGFDQRGMGRSEPSFATENCALFTHDPGYITAAVDYTEPSTIRAAGEVYKKRSIKCWNEPQFKRPVTLADGIEKIYHFLEYSGTRQLAEDINRVRQLFGDQEISIYGVSYGTKVMGTYATMFPQTVNLMVLDGNMDPSSDVEKAATDDARSHNNRIEYFISACERNPGACPVRNMRTCIKAMNELIKLNIDELNESLNGLTGEEWPAKFWIFTLIIYLFGDYQMTPDLCKVAEAGDFSSLQDMIISAISPNKGISVSSNSAQDKVNTLSKPTEATDDWPFPGYSLYAGDGDAAYFNVHAQDYAHGAYDEDTYVNFLYELNKKYPGADTQSAVNPGEYNACYNWPRLNPTPPIGSAFVGGIISGQLYDPSTAFITTQNMREHFPSTHLLTSRSVNHGLKNARQNFIPDRQCQQYIVDYFSTGEVGFVDGTVCESDPILESCTIENVIVNGQC